MNAEEVLKRVDESTIGVVPACSMPANRQDLVVQRMLLRHRVSRDLATHLVKDIKRLPGLFRESFGVDAHERG